MMTVYVMIYGGRYHRFLDLGDGIVTGLIDESLTMNWTFTADPAKTDLRKKAAGVPKPDNTGHHLPDVPARMSTGDATEPARCRLGVRNGPKRTGHSDRGTLPKRMVRKVPEADL